MARSRRIALVLANAAIISGALLSTASAPVAMAQEIAADGRDDVTVVAVVDGSFNPYHWNFSASTMPQHVDQDPGNDLPVDEAPHTWIPGFPAPGSFSSYKSLDLTLDTENPSRTITSLQSADASQWSSSSFGVSSGNNVHYRYIPGTKFVGAVRFGTAAYQGSNTAHGNGTSSVAVGNIHGSCPECVLVAVTYGGADREAASNWAMRQPWIDIVSNSFGFSQVERERLYSGSDTELQKTASERGQTIFFSSGNGISNTFTIPNSTLFSSQEGPDWIVTVGGVSTTGGNFTGAGKPADIAAPGSGYPSGYGGTTVNGTGNFSGTSNSTPVIAGMYGRALHWARQRLAGPSTVQAGGVIAQGEPVVCGAARPTCELGDGMLTSSELRTRLFHGAVRTPQGPNPGNTADSPVTTVEHDFLAEGHGTYFGRLRGLEAWAEEEARITGPMDGTTAALNRSPDERDWMRVDSYCRQEIWGSWGGGYFTGSATTPLPGPSPLFPIRSALSATCGQLFPPV
jgi:hypothetical protein